MFILTNFTLGHILNIKYSNNFIVGSKKGLYLFATIKIPLLIISTLARSIINSNLFLSSIKLSTGSLPFLNTVIFTPIVEEIIFRGIIQESIKKVAVISINILGICQRETLQNRKEWVNETSYKISRVATSIIFGLAHYPFGGIVQATSAGLGAYFGEAELKEKLGLSASIGCHITTNFLGIVTSCFLNFV